jgi:hypothetical protein
VFDARRKTVTIRRLAIETGLAVILGWCVLALPVLLDPGRQHHTAAFLPFMGDVVEGGKPISLLLLLGLAGVLGWYGRSPILLLGPATVLTLPLWCTLDIRAGATGHSLLGLELIGYSFLGLISTVGVAIGRALHNIPNRTVSHEQRGVEQMDAADDRRGPGTDAARS